jgi:hypothetical protein
MALVTIAMCIFFWKRGWLGAGARERQGDHANDSV